MSLTCPSCRRVLEYSGEPPSFCGYCGGRLNPTPTVDFDPEAETRAPRGGADGGPPGVPEQVGGYRIVRPLGAGGMGTVYEAEETATGRRVALKLIAPDFAASAETVERFRQEGRLASGIAHSRCVFVLAADEDAGRPYIVMELMPGDTLDSLVQRHGPLPPAEAVAKILDVIEGLREAHRLGVVHRDVKPSNCFLEADGRVKVGDFGLAKSLVNQAHLTKTGTFLGTLLYCSPEQVRGQAVDRQSDLYAVAATLYYLLAGQAPFQTGDAAATLARIVADPAPPVRTLRPEVPAALDQVVLRGLERDRPRRWRSLDDFRAALLPFAPGQLSIGGVGLRFGAYLLDSLLLAPLHAPPGLLLLTSPAPDPVLWRGTNVVAVAVNLLYFALSEGLWGCTLGKRWLRLRVWTVPGSDVPGLRRALLRTGTWFLLMGLPSLVVRLLSDPAELLKAGRTYFLVGGFQLVALVAGILALLSTMRARNGYRCLHDFVSGTRVVRLPEPEGRHALPAHRLEEDLVEAVDVPLRLGNYIVRGAFRESAGQRVLLAEDPGLGRPALLWLRPAGEPPLPPERRDCARASRLRWLAAGRNGDVQWDAFLAPAGCPLQSLVRARGRLSWAETRPLLVRLTEELVAAMDDDTLPERLTVVQVWIHGDQQVLLLDMPFGGSPAEPNDRGTPEPAPVAARSLLRGVAVLTLEGRPRTAGAPPDAVRAPVPVHAAYFLAGLLGAPPPLENLDQVRAELAAMHGRPTHVTRPRRAAHLALQAAFLAVGLGFMTVSGCLPTFVPTAAVRGNGLQHEQTRADLEEGAWREFAVAALNPAPTARLGALVQVDADLLLAERLRERTRQAFREHDARLEAMSPPMRAYMRAVELQAEPQVQAMLRAQRERLAHDWPAYRFFFRQRADFDATQPGPPVAENLARAMTVVVPVWPVLWVLWAFALRGSLSYRILGLTLVRPDGRPAPRWRCAWRALLVWAPVTALLVASIWLDFWYWPTWRAGVPSAWLLRLALLAWWAVWPLFAAYVALALWHPARGPHDGFAGTYLVPR